MNNDIYEIIKNYLYDYEKEYQLVDWININNVDWSNLSKNPRAIPLLKKNKQQ